MKKIQLFFFAIMSLFATIFFTSCENGNDIEYKKQISDLNQTISEQEQVINRLQEENDKFKNIVPCEDYSIHAYGLKGLLVADRNIPYKVLYIETIPVYSQTDEGKDVLFGETVKGLLSSETKDSKDIYFNLLYQNDEFGKNNSPNVKEGDIVWIDESYQGEGSETILVKK